MQTEKTKWVEDVLGSADSISRANVPDMTEAILSRAGSRKTAISPSVVWRIAASLLLLVVLNVTTILIHNSSAHESHGERSQDTISLFGFGGSESNQVDLSDMFFGNQTRLKNE